MTTPAEGSRTAAERANDRAASGPVYLGRRPAPDALVRRFLFVAGLLGAVTILYLARGVLIPVAVAVLLTFLLHPVVTGLERLRIGRIPSVLIVVLLAFAALAGIAWALVTQLSSLGYEIPLYRDNLKAKIAHVRGIGRGSALEQAQSAARELIQELEREETPKTGPRPLPVIVKGARGGLWQLPSVLEGLASTMVVVVLVVFMLLWREDLRNRLLRLIGYDRMALTTHALDDAGERISRYLQMQTVVNASFGIGLGLGLAVIGIPYAVVWGFLAAMLRFVPYVGHWSAGLLVTVFALAVYPGWREPLLVLGLFAVLDLLTNMVLEPMLYRQSTGVSPIALLVSVIFWTWLWGPIGILLATPLTVCLVVLAKHVPELEFMAVLVEDQPPLPPDVRFYQRLLAMDQGEAAEILEAQLAAQGAEAAFDGVVIPALNHARFDRYRDRLDAAEEAFIWRATSEILEHLDGAGDAEASPHPAPASTRRLSLLAIPARDEADALTLRMLQQLLDRARWETEVTSPQLLAAEVLDLVAQREPDVICIGASGGSAGHARYLCKRLRARWPNLPILVGRWGIREGVDDLRRELDIGGATHVDTTLQETRAHLELLHGLDPGAAPGDADSDESGHAPGSASAPPTPAGARHRMGA